jgi:hypothetical protein
MGLVGFSAAIRATGVHTFSVNLTIALLYMLARSIPFLLFFIEVTWIFDLQRSTASLFFIVALTLG